MGQGTVVVLHPKAPEATYRLQQEEEEEVVVVIGGGWWW